MSNKFAIVSVALISLGISGCASAPSAFEQQRIQECEDLYYQNTTTIYEQDPENYPVIKATYTSSGSDTGTVYGEVAMEPGSNSAAWSFQCSVSGLDVQFDFAKQNF
jgi:hypothetical protein